MPTYDVKVRFRGLCPFVPGADLDKGGQPAWVGSFLVNASHANREQFRAMDLPEHLPFLCFKGSDLAAQPRASQTKVMLPLEFEDVVFVPSDGTQKQLRVNFAHNPPPAGPAPLPLEERLFNWVTRMSDVMARSGRVDPDCFAAQPRENRIVARVHIDHGMLETDELGNVNNQVIVSQLGTGPRQQATARSVLLTMQCEVGNPFRIKTRRFRVTDDQTVRELVFRDPGPGNSLELEIVNLCVDDLLLRERREATLERVFRPDHDFRWNYLLSSGVRSLLSRPVPIPVTPGARALNALLKAIRDLGGGGSDGSQCSPPRTDPATTAATGTMQQTVSTIGQG